VASSARNRTEAPYRTPSAGSSTAPNASGAANGGANDTTGTDQASSAGCFVGVGRGVNLTSSGESSGAERRDGNSSIAVPGLPGTTSASSSAGTANGCGRADRNARLELFTARSELSAHRHMPCRTLQNPCTTSIRRPTAKPSANPRR
jgi:hypothetical protein